MRKQTKNKFANIIIAVCVAVSTVITLTALGIMWLTQEISSTTMAALLGFWGGELLIVALRQIFGSDIVKQTKTQNNKFEEDERI